MKKTLKFDDGSILVGSSSTFTVTQEDQGDIDIFDIAASSPLKSSENEKIKDYIRTQFNYYFNL